jgi:hypothetical protein
MASLLSLRFVGSLEIHEALLGAARCDAAAMSALLCAAGAWGGVVAGKRLLKVPSPPSPSIDSNSRPGLIGLQGQGPCRVL